MARAARAAAGATALLLTLAATALGDTATLSVLTTTGESDPAAGVPRIFALDGTTSVPKSVYVKTRATGGAPCAPTAQSDSGDLLYANYTSYFYGSDVNGSFRLQAVDTWPSAGDWMFCIWLSTGDSTTITTPITQTITFRGPSGAISAHVDPATPGPQQRTVITVNGSTETPAEVFAKIRRAGGAGCAPTASSDTGTYLLSEAAVNGAFSLPTETRQPVGSYLVCVWLADSSSDTTPISGPQSATFTVVAPPPPPPPPCVVPALGSDRRGRTVKAQIRAANCRVGARTRVYSRKRKGDVIRLSPRTGTQLPSKARVGLTISKGRRPQHHRRR
jgi:hypothetical protein